MFFRKRESSHEIPSLSLNARSEWIALTTDVSAREGDFVETSEGLFFDVKGFLHPRDRVIAYLRYVPDGRGNRKRAGIRYRKVYSLYARAKLLRRRWPEYVYYDPHLKREVQAVPLDRVRQHYLPAQKLTELQHDRELKRSERLALDMAQTLSRQSRISISQIGVSGSILVGLQRPNSDIDLIVYGTVAARRCHSKLAQLLRERCLGFRPYGKKDLRKLYVQRGLQAAVPFETFAMHEQPKVLQGKFRDTDYFIRCVKQWGEVHENYGDKEYSQIGRASVRATIDDDSESIFTPCTYKIVDVHGRAGGNAPAEIVSFRGRFTEQVRKGQKILARGKLEQVMDESGVSRRLVIGEDPRDCLVTVEKRG